MRERVGLRILDNAFTRWRNYLRVYGVADRLYEDRLKARMVKRWTRHLAQISVKFILESQPFEGADHRAVMRVWKAHKNGRLLEQIRSQRLKALALKKWKDKLDVYRADEVRAEKYSARTGSFLAARAISMWKAALKDVRSREQLADAFHMSHLAIVTVHQWRKRLRQRIKMVKVAKAASHYFQMRQAWFRWIEMFEARRRERLLQLYEVNQKKRVFEAWLHKAQLYKARNMAVQEMQHRIAERILRSTLARWTERVIALKSRELDISQHCNMVVLA
ncbi:hypothetical protein H1R20_g6288, partial [Candolleomyces eurysporus]